MSTSMGPPEATDSAAEERSILVFHGRLDRWNRRPSKVGTGFDQPLQAHEH
jgi:hypothetical protein